MSEFQQLFINIVQDSFLMMFAGSILASSFHLQNNGKLLNPFSYEGITNRSNWIYIVLNIFIVSLVGVLLAYAMYNPPAKDILKALFAGASTTILLNSANLKSLQGDNNG